MKKQLLLIACIIMQLFIVQEKTQAQIFKGFGKKIEKKVEQMIERKADRRVDNALNKADKKTDEPIDNLLNPSKDKAKNEKAPANTQKQESFSPVAERPADALVLMGANCKDFSWFKKGSVLEYEAFDDKGRLEGSNRMEVQELSSKGSATIAAVKASLKTPNFGDLDYQMNYVCDGDIVYMDLSALMKAMMENNPEMKNKHVSDALKNMEMDYSDAFASFPKKMYPGMKLKDLNFAFKTQAGSTQMAFNTQVTARQVIDRESITTPAGKFDCLKIRSVTNTTINVMGMKQQSPATVEYIWIAPSVGMIKQESHSQGALTSSMILKAYKL